MADVTAAKRREAELRLAKESISRALPALFQTSQSTVATIGDLHLFEVATGRELPDRIPRVNGGTVSPRWIEAAELATGFFSGTLRGFRSRGFSLTKLV